MLDSSPKMLQNTKCLGLPKSWGHCPVAPCCQCALKVAMGRGSVIQDSGFTARGQQLKLAAAVSAGGDFLDYDVEWPFAWHSPELSTPNPSDKRL